MSKALADSSKGHCLLSERVQSAESSLLLLAGEPFSMKVPLVCRSWYAGGLGSSSAHARTFVRALNRFSKHRATFVASSDNYGLCERGEAVGWVYFSQGFSSNAVSATRGWESALETTRILVTAASPDSLRASGQLTRAIHLERLIDSGVRIVRMPGLDEYTLLIRLIGPLCGYYVALQLAALAGADMQLPGIEELVTARDAACNCYLGNRESIIKEWIQGAALNVFGFDGACIENLSLKRLEGIYEDASEVRDLMEYAHGYFQREVVKKSPQWVLCNEADVGHAAIKGFSEMNASMSIPYRLIPSPNAFPTNIFFYEMLCNRVLEQAVIELGIDQINWPGKGRDGPLYTFEEPLY